MAPSGVYLDPSGDLCYRYVHGSPYQVSGANALSDDRSELLYGRSFDMKERAMQESACSSKAAVNLYYNPGPRSGQEDELVGMFVHTGVSRLSTVTTTRGKMSVMSYHLVRREPAWPQPE
jgi:hypothetical protein